MITVRPRSIYRRRESKCPLDSIHVNSFEYFESKLFSGVWRFEIGYANRRYWLWWVIFKDWKNISEISFTFLFDTFSRIREKYHISMNMDGIELVLVTLWTVWWFGRRMCLIVHTSFILEYQIKGIYMNNNGTIWWE